MLISDTEALFLRGGRWMRSTLDLIPAGGAVRRKELPPQGPRRVAEETIAETLWAYIFPNALRISREDGIKK